MKIGFVGNVNNYPFVLANAIRSLGHDVLFIVDSRERLHRPECKVPEAAKAYGDWIHDVSPVRFRDLLLPTLKNRKIRKLLNSCDALVVNGASISLARYFSQPYFVVLAGSDLDVVANPNALSALAGSWKQARLFGALISKVGFSKFIRIQRDAISRALGVDYALPGMLPESDHLLEELGVKGPKRHCFMVTDIRQIPFVPPRHNKVLRLLSMARLNWVKPMPKGASTHDDKCTDEMLRGVAMLIQSTSIPVDLRIVRKGMHVQETLDLVNALGLERHVSVLDEMTQQELSLEIRDADVVLDQFGDGSVGVAVRDALAMGRPVVANAKPEIYKRWLGEEIPVFQARRADEIAAQLRILISSNEAREKAGIEGRAFAERWLSAEHAAHEVIKVLSKAINKDEACPQSS